MERRRKERREEKKKGRETKCGTGTEECRKIERVEEEREERQKWK